MVFCSNYIQEFSPLSPAPLTSSRSMDWGYPEPRPLQPLPSSPMDEQNDNIFLANRCLLHLLPPPPSPLGTSKY